MMAFCLFMVRFKGLELKTFYQDFSGFFTFFLFLAMDSNIKFDPSVFTAQQLERLKLNLLKKTYPPDEDGCMVFSLKSRCGNYPNCKIGAEFGRPFGDPRANFNPSRILKSIETNQIIYKHEFNELFLSHLCGNPLCMNIGHLIFETLDNNNKRQDCHADKRCHGLDRHKLPICYIRNNPIKIL